MSPTHMQTHNAGRHYAVAEALLRGLPAKLVGARTHVEINGQQARVQVAAQGAWMIDPVDEFAALDDPIHILVDLTDRPPAFYICPGPELRAAVLQRHRDYLSAQGGTRPRNPESKHSSIKPAHVAHWRDQWERLSASG